MSLQRRSEVRRTDGVARPHLEALEDRWLPSTFHEFLIPTSAAKPIGIATGVDGNLWFSENGAGVIGHVTPEGQFVEIALPTAGIAPLEITSGPDGNLWFTEQRGTSGSATHGIIGRMGTDGSLTEFQIPATGNNDTTDHLPAGIVAGPDGNLWFTEFAAGKVGFITPGGTITEFTLSNTSAGPYGIAAGPDGNLWFTEQNANRIGRITTAGSITEFNLPSDPAGPAAPWGIVSGPDGNLWVTLSGTSKIARVTPTGSIVEFTPPTPGKPQGIVAAPDGKLYFAETAAGKLGSVTPSGAFLEYTIPTALSFPQDLTIGPDGNLWFTELNGNRIGELVLPHYALTGADTGGGPHVQEIDNSTGVALRSFFAYDPSFTGGVRVAFGDVNHDNIPDIIVAPGPGMAPTVRIFDGLTGKLIREFDAYSPAWQGGVFVAAADINRDGYADIVTGADRGGGPQVIVFDGKTGSILSSFYAYSPLFPGGVRVAAADVNGDGFGDVITGAGPGGGPHVEVWSGKDLANNTRTLLRSFYAYSSSFTGGVYVASGDTNDDGFADIVTGPGAGMAPLVKVYSGGDNALLHSFLAYSGAFTGGVRVGVADVDGDNGADIFTAPGAGLAPQVNVFDGNTLAVLDSFFAYNPAFQDGVFVGGH